MILSDRVSILFAVMLTISIIIVIIILYYVKRQNN